ncbi:MAG: hypothetical protein AB1798_23735 [Spirochaetota bacterium]
MGNVKVIKFLLAVIGLGIINFPAAAAEGNDPPLERQPSRLPLYLGITLKEAFDLFGVPVEVFSYRGEAEWQDTVVFYYQNQLYMFWFNNRVWQIRVDSRYTESVLGLVMGDSRSKVLETLGQPFHTDEYSVLYNLPSGGFPIKARFFFDNERLNDIYIFRGDF